MVYLKLKGHKKSLEGRMQPAGCTLAMSDIYYDIFDHLQFEQSFIFWLTVRLLEKQVNPIWAVIIFATGMKTVFASQFIELTFSYIYNHIKLD